MITTNHHLNNIITLGNNMVIIHKVTARQKGMTYLLRNNNAHSKFKN